MNFEDFWEALPTPEQYLPDTLNNHPDSRWVEEIQMHRVSDALGKLLTEFSTAYNRTIIYHQCRRIREIKEDERRREDQETGGEDHEGDSNQEASGRS